MKSAISLVALCSLLGAGCHGDDDAASNGNSNERCGDGVRSDGEECDDGPDNSDALPDACRTDCRRAGCGDGVIDASELCDTLALDGQSCETMGYATGDLVCAPDCTFDLSGCTSCGNDICEDGETASSCPADCRAVKVATGPVHTCALLVDGSIRCWGSNFGGQLGDGTQTDSLIPLRVQGLAPAIDLIAARYFSCALLGDTTVQCWGIGFETWIGPYDNPQYTLEPRYISDVIDATSISGHDEHVCAVLADGTALCWGDNSTGQLGNGDYDSLQPFDDCCFYTDSVRVEGLEDIESIAAGFVGTCAVLADGSVRCWGFGQGLGDGLEVHETCTFTNDMGGTMSWDCGLVPVTVALSDPVRQVARGAFYACALLRNGGVMCWGRNDSGQLGDGTHLNRVAPVAVLGLTNVAEVSAGGGQCGANYSDAFRFSACALLKDGHVRCWGSNDYGQLGDGTTNDSSVPVAVGGLRDAVSVSIGCCHACAIRADGTIWCWGSNLFGQLGDGTMTHRSTVVPVIGL